jgi:hypothetical protein
MDTSMPPAETKATDPGSILPDPLSTSSEPLSTTTIGTTATCVGSPAPEIALEPEKLPDKPSLLTEEEQHFHYDEQLLLVCIRESGEAGLDATQIQAATKRRWDCERIYFALLALYRKRLTYPTLFMKSSSLRPKWKAGSIEDAIKKNDILATLSEHEFEERAA